MHPSHSFDYRTATRAEIEARAKGFERRWLIDLQPTLAPMVPSSPKTKGIVGRIYEASFGIPANSLPGPDFPAAAIELKSVPILVTGGEAKAKERISISMIDFARLVTQTWELADVRKKPESMLITFTVGSHSSQLRGSEPWLRGFGRPTIRRYERSSRTGRRSAIRRCRSPRQS